MVVSQTAMPKIRGLGLTIDGRVENVNKNCMTMEHAWEVLTFTTGRGQAPELFQVSLPSWSSG